MPSKPEYVYYVDILEVGDLAHPEALEERLNRQFGKFSLILAALVPLEDGRYLTIAYTPKDEGD